MAFAKGHKLTDLRSIYRLWLAITFAFMLLAGAVAAGVILQRSLSLEDEQRQTMLRLVGLHLEKDYPKVAEELYLHLGSIERRSAFYQNLLQDRGVFSLTFDENHSDIGEFHSGLSNAWTLVGSNKSELHFPLYFASQPLGTLRATITWDHATAISSHAKAITLAASLLIGLAILWVFAMRFIQKRVFTPLLESAMQMQKMKATTDAAQLLAHDIKHPASMVKLAVDMIRSAETPEALKAAAEDALDHVDRALLTVDRMIEDIVTVGSDAQLNLEVVDPKDFLKSTVTNVLKVQKAEAIPVSFQFEHTSALRIDSAKVTRAVANIVSNAIDAFGEQSERRMWVKTTSESGAMGTVTIGNNGPLIPKRYWDQLFSPFFTKNKRSGTGLGLASVKKIVEDHGGTILCRSERGVGVEFVFTLPAAAEGSRQQ